MEDMYVSQHAKGELNWSTDGTVIGANVHTYFPPTQTLFTINLCILYLNIYLYIQL